MNLEKIDSLPQKLGLPERYGKVVLAEVIELFPDLPETAAIYHLPESPGEGA